MTRRRRCSEYDRSDCRRPDPVGRPLTSSISSLRSITEYVNSFTWFCCWAAMASRRRRTPHHQCTTAAQGTAGYHHRVRHHCTRHAGSRVVDAHVHHNVGGGQAHDGATPERPSGGARRWRRRRRRARTSGCAKRLRRETASGAKKFGVDGTRHGTLRSPARTRQRARDLLLLLL